MQSSADLELVSVARLRVAITDVNDKSPKFQGVDANGRYPAAVSDYTRPGDGVIFVSAIDEDTTSPNNEVTYRAELFNLLNVKLVNI